MFVALIVPILFLCRALNVFPLSALINSFRHPKRRVSTGTQVVMWFAGMRGPLSFALAVSLDDSRYPMPLHGQLVRQLMSATLVAIASSAFLLAPATAPLIRSLPSLGGRPPSRGVGLSAALLASPTSTPVTTPVTGPRGVRARAASPLTVSSTPLSASSATSLLVDLTLVDPSGAHGSSQLSCGASPPHTASRPSSGGARAQIAPGGAQYAPLEHASGGGMAEASAVDSPIAAAPGSNPETPPTQPDGEAPTTFHRAFRRFDTRYLKPLFGGAGSSIPR